MAPMPAEPPRPETMLTQFYTPDTGSLAQHVVLEWVGEPYEAMRAKCEAAELRAVDAAGSVPALQREDGWAPTQAGAIFREVLAKEGLS
jgi:glutathione S-transferase